MDTLSDLISVVNKKRLSKIDVLDKTFLNAKSENLYYKLYNAIETKQITTDEEAARLIYKSGKNDSRYKMLKSRLKEKVLKSVMLLDGEDAFKNVNAKFYYKCIQMHNTIEALIKISGTSTLVYKLVKQDYKVALKYRFYNILKNYSYMLMSYYVLNGDENSYEKESKNYRKYTDFANKEQQAKFLYIQSCIFFVNQKPVTEKSIKIVKSNLNELRLIKKEEISIEADFFYYYLAAQYYLITNEFHKLIEICMEAEKKLQNDKLAYTNIRMISMIIYKAEGLLRRQFYNEGLTEIKKLTPDVVTFSLYNFFVLKELEFKLCLQNNQINEAKIVFQQIIRDKNLKSQFFQLTEKWKIYHAYLVFMDSYLNKGEYKFNLQKFLNDTPVNSKDKSGFNFAIRVIEVLFHAARKQYNRVFAQMDALRVYRTRYLNDNTYKRNHLFLSLLLKAEKSGFNYRELQKANWNEIGLLKERKNIIADWEIIPYETLWDIFVDLAMK